MAQSKSTQLLVSILIALSSLLSPWTIKPGKAAIGPYCQFDAEEVAVKEKLLKASLEEEETARLL